MLSIPTKPRLNHEAAHKPTSHALPSHHVVRPMARSVDHSLADRSKPGASAQ